MVPVRTHNCTSMSHTRRNKYLINAKISTPTLQFHMGHGWYRTTGTGTVPGSTSTTNVYHTYCTRYRIDAIVNRTSYRTPIMECWKVPLQKLSE